MEEKQMMDAKMDLTELCAQIRACVQSKDWSKGTALTANAMRLYPDAPQPHNLLGLLLVFSGNKVSAMKHFRAAAALDPAYRPARQNIERCGNIAPQDAYAFDEQDCVSKKVYLERMQFDAIF